MGRLLSLAFIAVLAVSAGSIPQRVTALLPRSQAGDPAFGGAIQTGDLGDLRRLLQQAERLQNDAATEATGLQDEPARAEAAFAPSRAGAAISPEARQLLADISPEAKEMRNPLMDALLRASRRGGASPFQALQLAAMARRVYEENQASIMAVVWAVPSVLLVLSLLCSLLGAKGWARFTAELCSALSKNWLMLVSFAAVGAFLGPRVNLWAELLPDLWAVPVGALVLGAAMLRAQDMNSPVWNRLMLGLAAPLFSCAVILGWDRALNLARGLL